MTEMKCLHEPTEDIYKVLLDNSLGKVIIKDTKDKILWCNARAVKMFDKQTVQDCIGRSPTDLWPVDSDVCHKFSEMDEEVINSGESKLGTAKFVEWIDNKNQLIRVDKIPYRNSKGHIAGVVTFVMNMTSALEEHIDKYERDMVYHDLRSNLGNIISILKDKEESTEKE